MPRTLNVEKLQKKFAILTRSRESIQGLSSWIMHHKEFYQEIVEEWLNALKKEEFNALNMFYVANDVIQHCGKKKAPEYRAAFSTVLENALSFAKVKEIKVEVARMLTLWHDKEIYDDIFFRHLETTLNNEPPAPEINDEEAELTDSEIVSCFKLKHLVEAIENLDRIIDEVNCKEAKLKNLKYPETFNVEDIIIRMDKKDTYKQYKKADAYCKYVDDLIASIMLLNDAREDVLKHLKYTTVFYTVQNEEVKKVVHAYRIYGKKLKIMEKSLSEKLAVLRELFPSPIPESPGSDHSSEFNLLLNSSTVNLNQELLNTVDSNQNSSSSYIEYTEDTDHGIYAPIESPGDTAESTESIHAEDTNFYTAVVRDTQTKLVTSSDVTLKSKQEEFFVSEMKNEVNSNIKDSELNQKNDVDNPAERELTDIDFLLEKAYDERQVKKANIKRKIETLLKSKGSKTCRVSDSEKDDQSESNELKLLTKEAICTIENNNSGNKFDNAAAEIASSEEKMQISPCQNADNKAEQQALQTVATADVKNENQEHDVSSIDKASCHSKISKEDLDNKNRVTKSCAPIPQPLSDIPLELLKSIIDKNILNACSSSQETILQKGDENGESNEKQCFNQDAASSAAIKKSEVFPLAELKPDHSDTPTHSSQNLFPECVTSSEVTKFKEENLLLDKITDEIHESTISEVKSLGSKTENIDTEKLLDNQQYNKSLIHDVSRTDVLNDTKASSFLETLETTLKYLTESNLSLPNFKDNKKHIPQSAFSDMKFENSLRIYNFLLQCNQAVGFKENRADNLAVNKGELTNAVNSSKVPQKSNNNESSRHDNLELMDMDVDSEDDS